MTTTHPIRGRTVKPKVLICGLNFAPERIGIGKYTGELASHLSSNGYHVTVITTPPYYPAWRINSSFTKYFYRRQLFENLSIFRCPIYVPRDVTILKRILHLITFCFSTFPILFYQLLFRKHQLVLSVEPTLANAPCILTLCKIRSIPTWLHIQDFELDALSALGGHRNSLITKIDCFLTKRFDHVSTISPSMMHIAERNKGVEPNKLFLLPNWVDTAFLKPCPRDTYRNLWGFGKNDKVVMYSGNLGNKQGLDVLPMLAQRFESDDPNVKFVIVGDGTYRRTLEKFAGSLNNLYLFPLQPYEKLPEMLSAADIHLIIQKRGFADLVMPSKLTSILACGCFSIITADKDTELGNLVMDNPGIARLVEPENVDALCAALRKEFELSQERGINQIARDYAIQFIDQNKILSSFEKKMEEMILHSK